MCEYLLYMWQVEDTLRAFSLDEERLERELLPQFQLTPEQSRQQMQWYVDLIDMMRREGVTEKGHLQMNQSTLALLSDLHQELLHSSRHPFYSAAYYKTLPYIVELRAKNQNQQQPEIETCLDAMYGVLMLRLQKREISAETSAAVSQISHLLALLSDAYKKDKEGTLEL